MSLSLLNADLVIALFLFNNIYESVTRKCRDSILLIMINGYSSRKLLNLPILRLYIRLYILLELSKLFTKMTKLILKSSL